MGFYIQAREPKALSILDSGHAVKMDPPTEFNPPEGKAFVCVIRNGPFDAAAIVYSHDEMEEFLGIHDPSDTRARSWLLVDKGWVIEQCPPVKGLLS